MEMSHWENWITEEQYILYIVFNIIYFFHQLCLKCPYFVSNKLRKWTIISTNTHFKIRTTYDEFQSSIKIMSQRNLIFDYEISFTAHTTYHKLQYKKQIPWVHVYIRARSGTVVWGTLLQARLSHIPFLMVPLEFLINSILFPTLQPYSHLSL